MNKPSGRAVPENCKQQRDEDIDRWLPFIASPASFCSYRSALDKISDYGNAVAQADASGLPVPGWLLLVLGGCLEVFGTAGNLTEHLRPANCPAVLLLLRCDGGVVPQLAFGSADWMEQLLAVPEELRPGRRLPVRRHQLQDATARTVVHAGASSARIGTLVCRRVFDFRLQVFAGRHVFRHASPLYPSRLGDRQLIRESSTRDTRRTCFNGVPVHQPLGRLSLPRHGLHPIFLLMSNGAARPEFGPRSDRSVRPRGADVSAPERGDGGARRGYGTEERVPAGTLVFERGQRGVDFFLVLEGTIEIFDLDEHGEPNVLTVHTERQFTGELDLFSDRQILVSGRPASTAGWSGSSAPTSGVWSSASPTSARSSCAPSSCDGWGSSGTRRAPSS